MKLEWKILKPKIIAVGLVLIFGIIGFISLKYIIGIFLPLNNLTNVPDQRVTVGTASNFNWFAITLITIGLVFGYWGLKGLLEKSESHVIREEK
jgi:hypothetical protein